MVLGVGFTALLGAAGYLNPRPPVSPDGPYPNAAGDWGPRMMGSGMMGRFPAAPPSCVAPALPGAVVDATLTDMGGMMGPGMMNPNAHTPTRRVAAPYRRLRRGPDVVTPIAHENHAHVTLDGRARPTPTASS